MLQSPSAPDKPEPSASQLVEKVAIVRERLRHEFPTARFGPDTSFLDWNIDLSKMTGCPDNLLERFLRAGDYDVDRAVRKLQNHLNAQLMARAPQSAVVEETVGSSRLRYIGHSRGGAKLLCVDCLWGKFLEVEGGLETIMQALMVFNFRILWSMVERDVGRRTALTFPPVYVLFVGGSPPVSFVREGLRYFSNHYPGGLRKTVMFETSRFEGLLARTAFNFLPKGSTEYHSTKDRRRLFEILDVDDGYIPNSLLATEELNPEQQAARLASTAAIDREWGGEIRKLGHDVWKHDEERLNCSAQSSMRSKNTFVEVEDDTMAAARLARAGRERALSDTENTDHAQRVFHKSHEWDAKQAAAGNMEQERSNGADNPMYVQATHVQDAHDNGPQQGSAAFWKSTKPKNSGKRQVSGYTRRRRKQAIEKLLAEQGDTSLPVVVTGASNSQPKAKAAPKATALNPRSVPLPAVSSREVVAASATQVQDLPLEARTMAAAGQTRLIPKSTEASAATGLYIAFQRYIGVRPLLLLFLAIAFLARMRRQAQRRSLASS
jgi:hypothetical protein